LAGNINRQYENLKAVNNKEIVYIAKSFLFLPRDASAERGYEIACRLSVCL